jgi:hypothetical protein
MTVKTIMIALIDMSIVIVIPVLSTLDIQTMLPFMVKTHLGQVKTTLPPQAQVHTTTLHILILIYIATTMHLVSPFRRSIMNINATAEVDQSKGTYNLLIVPQVQTWTMKSDLRQLGPLKIHVHTNLHPIKRMHHTFTTLPRSQETLELQRCLFTT